MGLAKHSLKRIVCLLFFNLLTLQVIGTRWWVGRDNAILVEFTPSHAKCLETRGLPPPWPRCSSGFGCIIILVLVQDAVLGGTTLEVLHKYKQPRHELI